MTKREKIIKTREPGPEFQALASDWKPTKRRAWLVSADGSTRSTERMTDDPDGSSKSAHAEPANAALADARSADAALAKSDSALADPVVAEAVDAQAANAVRARAVPADAIEAHAEPETAEVVDAGAAVARSVIADPDDARLAPADSESAERASANSAPALAAIADPAITKASFAASANSATANAVLAGAPSAKAERANAKPAFSPSAIAKSVSAKPAYADSAPPGVEGSRGWTKMPNRLLEALARTDLSPRAVRVLLLLVRQTFGFHRRYAELSNTDLANATCIHISHITATVKELADRGYLGKTAGGGRAKSRYWLLEKSTSGDSEAACADSDDAACALSADAAPIQISEGSPRFLGGFAGTEIRNRDGDLNPKNGNLKNPIETERNSLSSAPLAWKLYTDTLTERSRERADQIFSGLLSRFPADDPDEIAAGPENLRMFGAPDGTPWTEIKSPHGLMESAWPQLRDFFRAKNAARRKREVIKAEQDREKATLESAETENDARISAEIQAARDAFTAAFPDASAQAAALERWKPSWVTNFTAEPGRTLAIAAWFRETNES